MQMENGLGWQVAIAIFGFFFAGGLSLATGNEVITSLTRGAIGMIGLFFIGYIIRIALTVFVGTVEQADEWRGTAIDMTAPEYVPSVGGGSSATAAEEDDFMPLFPPKSSAEEALKNMDPQKLAEALRHLDD